jgi:hypothetical protein
MRWLAPCEKTESTSLKLEDDADTCIKPSEVVGHSRDGEVRPLGEDWSTGISYDGRIGAVVVCIGGDDLREEPMTDPDG